MTPLTAGELVVQQHRKNRQKRSIEHDMLPGNDGHAEAAMCALAYYNGLDDPDQYYPHNWDDAYHTKLVWKDQIERLVDAGALILAEIEKLQIKTTK
jgi:hypothetical protein